VKDLIHDVRQRVERRTFIQDVTEPLTGRIDRRKIAAKFTNPSTPSTSSPRPSTGSPNRRARSAERESSRASGERERAMTDDLLAAFRAGDPRRARARDYPGASPAAARSSSGRCTR